nr:hypothetical protein GCM10020092_072880 [Actinoplanes digitatis]
MGMAAGSDQIALALVGEQIDHRGADLAALAAADREDAAAQQADPAGGEPLGRAVEEVGAALGCQIPHVAS